MLTELKSRTCSPNTILAAECVANMQTASSDFDWNDTTIGQLRALWAEGHSTAEIGRRLGTSKNAVVVTSAINRNVGIGPKNSK